MPLPFPSHFVCRWNRHWIDPALFPLFEEQDRYGQEKFKFFENELEGVDSLPFSGLVRRKTFFFFIILSMTSQTHKTPVPALLDRRIFTFVELLEHQTHLSQLCRETSFDWGDHALCRSDSLFLLRRFPRVSWWMMAKDKKKAVWRSCLVSLLRVSSILSTNQKISRQGISSPHDMQQHPLKAYGGINRGPKQSSSQDQDSENSAGILPTPPSHHRLPWVIDSGATNHMAGSHNELLSLQEWSGNTSVSRDHGTIVPVTGIGKVSLSHAPTLYHVFHVLFSDKNIVYVSKLTKSLNCFALFFPTPSNINWSRFSRTSARERWLDQVKRGEGDITWTKVPLKSFIMLLELKKRVISRRSLWHKRFGHVNYQRIPLS